MKPRSRDNLLEQLQGACLPADLPKPTRRRLLEEIADRISTFWRFQESTIAAKTSKERRALALHLRKNVTMLRKQIRALPESSWREIARAAGISGSIKEDWFNSISLPAGLARGTAMVMVFEHLLAQFEQWTEKSLVQLSEVRKGRRSEDDRVWLVGQIGSVYEHCTGLHFDRRRKSSATPADLIKHVLAIADPTYRQTPNGIDKLMRRAIAHSRNWPQVAAPRT